MVRWVVLISCVLGSSLAMAKDWPSKVPSRAQLGEELYDTHCVACHGVRAAGDGPAVAALTADVPDFSTGWGKLERDPLIRSVVLGKGVMPGFELAFDRDAAEKVVDWMGKLGRKTVKDKDKPEPDEMTGDEEEEAGEAPAPEE